MFRSGRFGVALAGARLGRFDHGHAAGFSFIPEPEAYSGQKDYDQCDRQSDRQPAQRAQPAVISPIPDDASSADDLGDCLIIRIFHNHTS